MYRRFIRLLYDPDFIDYNGFELTNVDILKETYLFCEVVD